jgi:hypothetical protein
MAVWMRFFKKNKSADLDLLNQRLAHSFAYVKDDISSIKKSHQNHSEWVNFLHQKMLRQEMELRSLRHHLSRLPVHQDVNSMVGEHPRFEQILKRIEGINRQVEDILLSHDPLVNKVNDHHLRLERLEKLDEAGAVRRPNLREKLAERINRKSKEYVKGLILSLIKKYDRITGAQLREIVVDEQALCSRSSFYRILDEIESSGVLEVIREQKDKVYIAGSTVKKHHDR